jgi:hypothetical protein
LAGYGLLNRSECARGAGQDDGWRRGKEYHSTVITDGWSNNLHSFWNTRPLLTRFPSLSFDLRNLHRHPTNLPHQMTKILHHQTNLHILRSEEVLYDSYEQPSFDDTTWAVAKNIGTYRFFDPGDAVVTLQCPPCPSAIALYCAGWIWTDVVLASGKVPAGSRAFRRVFTPAPN